MEKIEHRPVTQTDIYHHFYCDSCGEYLGEKKEFDDGYYENLGDFNLRFLMPNGWYQVKKCFCDKCKENYLTNVRNKLIEMGFLPDN